MPEPGEVLLICEECESWLKRFRGSVNLVCTDPPFAISNDSNNGNDWNGYTSDKGEWDENVGYEFVNLCYNTLVDGGLFACFGVYGSLVGVYNELMEIGAKFQSHIIYEKKNPAPSVHRRMYTHANEIILLFSKGNKWTFNYDIAKNLGGGKQLKNVWKGSSPKRILGRTRKPANIVENLILPLTNVGDYVLDPFCGSCSILEIAALHGRRCIGIDKDREIIDVAHKILSDKGIKVRVYA